MKIGFFYSGGGYWGISQVGATKALVEAGYKPDEVLTSSVGSFNGAHFVEHDFDVRPNELVWTQGLGRTGRNLVFPHTLGTLMRFITLRSHIFSDRGLIHLISRLDVKKICASPRRLEIVTYNERRKESQVFSNHDSDIRENPERLRTVLRASASYPGLFESVMIDGEPHCDALESSTESLFDRGCDLVFALITDPLDYNLPRAMSWFVKLRGISHQFTDMQLQREKRKYGDRLVILRPDRYVGRLSRTSFRGPEVVKKRVTKEEGGKLKKILEETIVREDDLTVAYRKSYERACEVLKRLKLV